MRKTVKKSIVSPKISVIDGVKSYCRLILSNKDGLLWTLCSASGRSSIFFSSLIRVRKVIPVFVTVTGKSENHQLIIPYTPLNCI